MAKLAKSSTRPHPGRVEQVDQKQVTASPEDYAKWDKPFQDENGTLYYCATIRKHPGAPDTWDVRCAGEGAFGVVRVFSDLDVARVVFNAIQPQTRLKTLMARGFRVQWEWE